MRNPDWVRDEIILAMDLYLRAGRRQLPPSHQEVVRLSQLLKRLPLHPPESRDENFRNPNGISMTLGNFLGIDPIYHQPGLSRNNQLQEAVWADFIDQPELLILTALSIEAASSSHNANEPGVMMMMMMSFLKGYCLPASIFFAKGAARQYLRRLTR